MFNLTSASSLLQHSGISHVIVHANVFGRAQYKSLRIKLNKKGQASEYWLAFLRKFKIASVPEKLHGVHAGVFKYVYCNRDRTICIWLQSRPDQNTVSPGHAGVCVLRVEDHAPFKFQAIERELSKISKISNVQVQIPIKRRQRKPLNPLDQSKELERDTATNNHTDNSKNTQNDKTKHELAMRGLQGSRFGNFDAFMKKYSVTRNKET